MASTLWTVDLVITILCGIYYISSVILMYMQRNVSPMKEHSITMIAISGLVGYIVSTINYPLIDIVGPNNLPCMLTFWALMAVVPVYRFPLLICCMDLYNNYLIAETIVILGEEKKKALSKQVNNLDKTTQRLITLKRRSSVAVKFLIAGVALVPTLILAFVGLSYTSPEFSIGQYGCSLDNISEKAVQILFVYVGLGASYMGISVYTLKKLNQITDVFHIKEEIQLVFRVQLICVILFALAQFVPLFKTFLNSIYFSPAWFINASFAITHFLVCVKPLMTTFNISFSCYESDLSNVVSQEEIRLEDILADEEGLKSFTKHLVREFSTENIEFWKEVKTYRNDGLIDPSTCIPKAQYLLNQYVKEGSDNWVNLPSKCRKELEEEIQKGNVTPTSFDKAQTEITFLMSKDSFARYKKGDLFTAYMVRLSEQRRTRKSVVQSVYEVFSVHRSSTSTSSPRNSTTPHKHLISFSNRGSSTSITDKQPTSTSLSRSPTSTSKGKGGRNSSVTGGQPSSTSTTSETISNNV